MRFNDFFKKVWGKDPYLWQSELAGMLTKGEWHRTLTRPPGEGKTAVILTAWLFSLYKDATTNRPRRTPLRCWYVVDRKTLVDDALQKAKELHVRLKKTDMDEVSKAIRNRFGVEEALVFAKIRGGLDREERNKWLSTPNQPTFISCTVDQIGSRLLFRPYGVSERMRSIHAGMAAVDSLIILDEAHLSQPLASLVDLVTSKAVPGLGDIPPTRIIEVTATPYSGDPFPFSKESGTEPALKQLRSAKREIGLVEAQETIEKELAKQAKLLAEQDGVQLVAVICNTVRRARRVAKELKNSVLFTGRLRDYEREVLVKSHINHMLKDKRDRTQKGVQYVVATQTIEVGIDLDFDALVTESCPFDNLRQRFGRLDRGGALRHSRGVIVHSPGEKDYVYGEASEATFKRLVEEHPEGVIANWSKVKDVGLRAKDNEALVPHDDGIFRLTHTNTNGPEDISSYIHGVNIKGNPDFTLVYRREITPESLERALKDGLGIKDRGHPWRFLQLAKPRPHELLTLPCSSKTLKGDSPDMESVAGEQEVTRPAGRPPLCVRYRDGEIIRLQDVKPGDLVFVPCEFGHYDQFGWNYDETGPAADVYDLDEKSALRLHPAHFPGFDARRFRLPEGEYDLEGVAAYVKQKIPTWEQKPDVAERAGFVAKKIKKFDYGRVRVTPDGKGLYFYPKRKSFGKGVRQELFAHCEDVQKVVKKYCVALKIRADLAEVLALAGKNHDLGKACGIFQQVLYSPSCPDPQVLLAKSGKNSKGLGGWRHELQSVAVMIENDLHASSPDPNLAIHLVASHHGWCRNAIEPCKNGTFTPFHVGRHYSKRPYGEVWAELDKGVFLELNRKYGPWGLAYLEALLRLADFEASRRAK